MLDAFYAYQNQHARRFLLIVNLLAQAAYLSYALADMVVVPDIATQSVMARTAYLLFVLPLVLWLFRRSDNIKLLDLLLPMQILFAALLWFELLARSSSPHVGTYLYASLIFIVLANLAVQVAFLPSLIVSILISAAIIHGVQVLNHGAPEALTVFLLVYLPIFLFSLFISGSITLGRRKAFFRSVLDEMTRNALHEANRHLHDLAHTDALTGLGNRRHFDAQAQREVARALRHRQPLCLMLFDVDRFKNINDTYGHDVGDKVLQALSKSAQQQLREHDLLARIGGEEYAVLLPDTGPAEALLAAERLRCAISECRVVIDEKTVVQCTVSLGVCELSDSASDLDAMMKAADEALYQAKQGGRNQTCLYSPPAAQQEALGSRHRSDQPCRCSTEAIRDHHLPREASGMLQ